MTRDVPATRERAARSASKRATASTSAAAAATSAAASASVNSTLPATTLAAPAGLETGQLWSGGLSCSACQECMDGASKASVAPPLRRAFVTVAYGTRVKLCSVLTLGGMLRGLDPTTPRLAVVPVGMGDDERQFLRNNGIVHGGMTSERGRGTGRARARSSGADGGSAAGDSGGADGRSGRPTAAPVGMGVVKGVVDGSGGGGVGGGDGVGGASAVSAAPLWTAVVEEAELPHHPDLSFAVLKLSLWRLPYDALIYVDADVLLLPTARSAIDGLWREAALRNAYDPRLELLAAYENSLSIDGQPCFNTGLMLLWPSAAAVEALTNASLHLPPRRCLTGDHGSGYSRTGRSDQGVLNHVFRTRWTRLQDTATVRLHQLAGLHALSRSGGGEVCGSSTPHELGKHLDAVHFYGGAALVPGPPGCHRDALEGRPCSKANWHPKIARLALPQCDVMHATFAKVWWQTFDSSLPSAARAACEVAFAG